MRTQSSILNKLNSLSSIPFDQWRSHGVSLKAVSANASGIVQSGITSKGIYFSRRYTAKNPEFVLS